ncbi:Toxin RTX-I translocation ATP-binding protein [Sporomusa ovata DSM 2662]|uniref:Cyclolysin secretion ATP-binding protein n=1 Tax=Sporomusa ovata TaxID=2378 RepID=A0A0U1L4Q5_9FIRM|nr:type I secretion system permease/ATPase [Sporomusa ovata]EQB26112.1 type I secretion system ABC transporter, HlyB family [Sporomusa ovata DSM 2662]CQR74687.1 cyclolysin secretion ATP-binding protein [Sporomusa ovata]
MNAQRNNPPQAVRKLDTALSCLVIVAKILGIPADEGQMRRAYVMSSSGMDTTTLIRAAKELGLKSRLVQPEPEKFPKLPLPAIMILKNNNYIVLVRTDGTKSLIIDPYKTKPFTISMTNLLSIWSGELVLITCRFHLKQMAERKFSLAWFIPVVMQYKRFFCEVLVVSFILQLFGLVTPMFTQVIIDKVLVHRSLNTLDILVFGMVAISLFQAWITALRSYLFTHTTNRIDVMLSTKLFRHIMALPVKYFETWQVGDVVARVQELDNVRKFITGSALTVVLDTIFAIVYIIVMFTYSSSLSLIALIALPIYVVLNLVSTPVFKKCLNERFVAGTEKQAFLIEAITGIQTVKSLAVESQFIQKWEQLLARYAKTALNTANVANVAVNIGGLIQQLFNLSILWFGAHAVMDARMSVGELIAFQMLSGQVIAPVLRLVNMWQYFQQTMVSVDRLGDILNETVEPAFNPNRTTLPSIRGGIVLDRVTFRYRNDTNEVLHQINLAIKPGSRVGIVGRSGSGKSTLTKLLQRLYVPESGRVLIDGVDLVQVEPAWLRRQIGVVLQENYLFNGSIRDNIAVARPESSLEEVEKAANIAGVQEFAAELANGYHSPVGERGSALSGGQRQRVAIARALLTNPRVLIFDEATSALDYESERIIMDNLDQIAAGRTMIMIAHRLSTVRRCDSIVVMEQGKIVEQGSHEELLSRKGMYYNLHRQQER